MSSLHSLYRMLLFNANLRPLFSLEQVRKTLQHIRSTLRIKSPSWVGLAVLQRQQAHILCSASGGLDESAISAEASPCEVPVDDTGSLAYVSSHNDSESSPVEGMLTRHIKSFVFQELHKAISSEVDFCLGTPFILS